jgi:hypothetical protein
MLIIIDTEQLKSQIISDSYVYFFGMVEKIGIPLDTLIEKLRKDNPYPVYIFPDVDITVENFEGRRDAMFGSFGRLVWNNCCDKINEIIEDEIEQKELK